MESKLEAEWKQWKEREQRYEKLFSSSVLNSREFLKEKLKHYDEIKAKVMAHPDQQDRIAMKAFDLERRELARKIYPNIFRRLIERMVSAIRFDIKVTKAKIESESNDTSIKASMVKAGLGDYYRQVQQHMKQGNREFSLPVSYQVSEQERMSLQLNFKKDDHGKYHFENYKTTLHSELEKGPAKEQTFPAGTTTMAHTVDNAYNLLAGRSVQINGTSSWHQLDFNDKDAEGNYRMKHFPANYGFNLEKELSTLPLKESDRIPLLQHLKDGNKVAVPLIINDKTVHYSIQANPLKKEIAVYDNAGQMVKLDELGKSQAADAKTARVQQLVPKQDYNKTAQKSKTSVKV